ncbi:MAG: acetolactate synthase large subunit [Xanthomonadales bacterium PRO6]|nr:Acetolactate synthase, catabolic [Xanthomonadales bacterium]MCE7932806.1 acetolactate synthase large subunit [Xanthomonadales bacterium PRO6]
MKASDLFVRALEAEGVQYVFGIPGEENLDFLESLRTSTIKLILTRHEQGAGFMAATWGRLTGEAGVCLATLGPGATNFVTPAAYAQLGAMPMLMITGQKPVKASKQGHFQIVDIVDMMKPLTKYTRQIVASDNIPARVREAFRRAHEERPGAVHLELPEDIADEETEVQVLKASHVRRPVADEKSIVYAVEAITNAKRPLLMVGAGANRKTTSKMLTEFVDKLGIPFFTTQMGKGVIDEAHPLWLGNAALSDGDFVHRAIEKADCIINCGHDVIEKPPFFMRKGLRTVIHLNFFSAEVDTVYFPQIEVVGDMANSIWRLKQRLEPQAHWDFGYFNQVRDALNKHLALRSDDERFPIHPVKMVGIIRDEVDKNGIVCLDNGMYKLWFARYYRCHEPNTMLLDNALATMGAGLPSAMAAKMVYPDRKVVAVAGDGGFMMNSQELETAVRYNLNIAVIVLRDNAYGMIKWKQSGMGFETFGMDMGNPDFVKLAEAFGARGWRPKSTEEFRQNLRQALAEPGVDLIELAIDYSENHAILNKEIKELSKAM